MDYDSIKRSLGRIVSSRPIARRIFYRLLDLLLLRAWHIRKEIRHIAPSIPPDAEILDAGAGFGQYAWRISRRAPHWHITGIDLKSEQVADCNQFVQRAAAPGRSIHFETADLTTFCRPEAYDLAIAIDVMEHIANDFGVFRNLRDSLRTGGILLISTPSDKGGSDAGHHRQSFIDEHVRNGYAPASIARLLISAGFTSVETRYTYGRAGHISWLLSMKYPMLLLRASRLFFLLLPAYYALVFPACLLLNLCDLYAHHKSGTGLLVKAIR